VKVIHQFAFCYSFFLFGIPWIFAQQARQIPFKAESLGYSISKKRIIAKGQFPAKSESKTYAIDPATMEFIPLAENDIPTDIVNNLNPNFALSPGIISIKEIDHRFYQPSFYAKFLDASKKIMYLPFSERNGDLVVYLVDPERLTLQEVVPFPNIPSRDTKFFSQLPEGINFAYATDDRIIIVQECENTKLFPEVHSAENIFLCGSHDTVFVQAPLGYDHLYYHSETNSYNYNDNIYVDSLPATKRGIYTYKVADENGCLSEPRTLFVQNAFAPSIPTLSTLGVSGYLVEVGTNNHKTVTQCQEEETMLVTGKNQTREEVFYVWSNRDTGAIIYVKEPGTFWVEAHTTSGCKSERSNELIITKINKSIPLVPSIVVVGDSLNICRTEREVFLETEEVYEAYSWYKEKKEPPSGGKTLRISKNFDEGDAYLRVRKEGCWSDFACMRVHFPYSTSVSPQIKAVDNILASTKRGNAYRWHRNDKLIPDSNKFVWVAAETGDYQVSIFNGFCWTKPSAKVFIP